ncbi:MAG: threonine--tRNA ligase [Actinomycetota bacterium]
MAERNDLDVLRHSTAHVMAQAVCDLWPGAKYAIGPPIEDGFYYDFELPEQLTPEDLPRIEARMREIVQAEQPFNHEEVPREEALQRFAGQPYKLEIIEGVEEAEGAGGDTVSVYRNDGWQDLCLGPHVEHTGKLGAFKLLSVAGAYWRGDERRQQLQRIYGTAWPTEEELQDYLHRREEAEKRDHRKLGPALDLFSFPDELGAGLAVWHPKGGTLVRQLGDFVREIHVARNYELVTTPHVARAVLWETSGHLEKYAGNMYPPMHSDGGDYYVKPMNCPFHVLIYKARTRSYRDLPLRLSELGTVYRHEKAGTLHGLLRIRGLSMDDAHIFCTPDQLIDEVLGVFDLTLEVFRVFGFEEPRIELSTKPGEAIGDEAMWARATEALRAALDKSGMAYDVAEGEGAFYGPKVDFHFRDAIGRSWQLTTVQCDFALPERFELEFMGEDNQRHRPVMIHRAILGSLERFIAILIEHHAGAFPMWLAPVQVKVIPIATRHDGYAEKVADRLREAGLRVEVDESRETLGKKVRAAQLEKVPYVLVVGDKEEQGATVAVRDRGGNEARGVPLEAFLARAIAEDKERALETGDVGAL